MALSYNNSQVFHFQDLNIRYSPAALTIVNDFFTEPVLFKPTGFVWPVL